MEDPNGNDLPDYESPQSQVQPPALAPAAPAQVVSQDAGAERSSRQRGLPPDVVGKVAGAGEPSDPDGDHSSDTSSKKRKASKEGSDGRPRSRDRRPGNDDNEGFNAKRVRRDKTSDSEHSQTSGDINELLAELPSPVQEYYHNAAGPECAVHMDKMSLFNFVFGLYEAFDEGFDTMVRPIAEYLDENGAERSGDALKQFRAMAFDRKWAIFMSELTRNKKPELKVQYEKLHPRLVQTGRLLLPPEDPSKDLNDFKLEVYKLENAELDLRWLEYAQAIWDRHGEAAGMKIIAEWDKLLMLTEDESIKLHAPPTLTPPPPPNIAPRGASFPEIDINDKERLNREAKSLGFDNDKFAGVWTFLSSLGAGGFGREQWTSPIAALEPYTDLKIADAGLWVKYDHFGKILDVRTSSTSKIDTD